VFALNVDREYLLVRPLQVQHCPDASALLMRTQAAMHVPAVDEAFSLSPYVGSIVTVDAELEKARYGFSG
jgi:hypothetical protein